MVCDFLSMLSEIAHFVFIFRVSADLLQNVWPDEVAFIPRGIASIMPPLFSSINFINISLLYLILGLT